MSHAPLLTVLQQAKASAADAKLEAALEEEGLRLSSSSFNDNVYVPVQGDYVPVGGGNGGNETGSGGGGFFAGGSSRRGFRWKALIYLAVGFSALSVTLVIYWSRKLRALQKRESQRQSEEEEENASGLRRRHTRLGSGEETSKASSPSPGGGGVGTPSTRAQRSHASPKQSNQDRTQSSLLLAANAREDDDEEPLIDDDDDEGRLVSSGSPVVNTYVDGSTLHPPQQRHTRLQPQQQQQQQENNTNSNASARFSKLQEIGRGAFGIVYLGMHNRTGEFVAIKEMDAVKSSELREEYEHVVGLNHENVVNVLAFEIRGRRARLFLEWVAGGSLADQIQRVAIREPLARSYTRQILSGLNFLHQNRVFHRDIKPKNILIDHRGVLKLTDFGLSKHFESMHHQTQHVAGTVLYMSPEAVRGYYGVGSDIWAVGATLCEMLTHAPPWSHLPKDIYQNETALLYYIGDGQGQPNHHPLIPSHVSKECQQFLEVCFAPLPENRTSCEELLRHPWFTTNAADDMAVCAGSPMGAGPKRSPVAALSAIDPPKKSPVAATVGPPSASASAAETHIDSTSSSSVLRPVMEKRGGGGGGAFAMVPGFGSTLAPQASSLASDHSAAESGYGEDSGMHSSATFSHISSVSV